MILKTIEPEVSDAAGRFYREPVRERRFGRRNHEATAILPRLNDQG